MLVTALLISGSQVRALLGSLLLAMTYGRLKSLPFVVCDKLVTSFLSILGQHDNGAALPLIGRVDVTHRRHNGCVAHQLFDLHNVNAGVRKRVPNV